MSCSLASGRCHSLMFPMGVEEGSFAFCRRVVPLPGECQGHLGASHLLTLQPLTSFTLVSYLSPEWCVVSGPPSR